MSERKTNVNPSVITMVPYDMDTNEYNAIVFELCDFLKEKSLP